MKRHFKHSHCKIAALISSALLLLASCSGLFNQSSENFDDGKAYISIGVSRVKRYSDSKTYYPTSISPDELINFRLTGLLEGEDSEKLLATAESITKFEKLEITPGAWTFTLSATYNGITYADTVRYNINYGNNRVSFELKSTAASGNGGFNITVDLSSDTNADLVKATLSTLDGSVKETKTFDFAELPSREIIYSKKNLDNDEESLTPGTYHLLFEFFAKNGSDENIVLTELNQWESYICILSQVVTEARISLNLNEVYTIEYYDQDQEPINFVNYGFAGTAIEKYSVRSHFTLPVLVKEGNVFLGWYETDDLGNIISENKVTEIEAGTTGNKKFKAQFFETVIYVSGTGYDNTEPDSDGHFGDGTETNPFETIDKACKYIINHPYPTADWTIYIDGDVTGPHEGTSDYGRSIIPVEITQEHAKSILLKGKNDPGETAGVPNAPTDMINRGLSSSSNSDTGSALVIATAVPVKVENLLIKNGCNKPANSSSDPYSAKGGGLFIASEATVTLGDGVIISNNNAKTAGGGIYNAGTLFINRSAEISSNNCEDGGGICNTGHLYLGYENASTEKEWTGSIKNNTSWRGAGIKNVDTGILVMNSGCIKYNSNVSNSNTYGGGIYNMGNFTMTGGVIEFNNCCHGGGVYVGYDSATKYGTFTFSDGIIRNNFASYAYGAPGDGGGIYNKGLTYIYGNAVIGDDSASGTPTDNTISTSINITETAISTSCSNLALGSGGGIYVAANGKLYLGYSRYVDATDNTPAVWNKGIYYNYAKEGGGGIAYGSSAKAVIFNSGTVSFNGAASNGAAAYIGDEGFVLGGTATIPSGNGDGSPKQTVHVRTNNFSLNIDNDLSHLDTGAIALLPQDNSNSSTPVPTSYNTYKPLIKLTDTAVANGVTIDSIKGKFTVENFTDPTSGRVTKWSINSEGKAQIETSAGFSASLDTGTADIVVFRNGNRFTPPIVESASSTSTITLDVKTIAGNDFDKSTMTLIWTFDGEELNRDSMPEAVSFRYSESDRQIDIKSGMLTKGTYDVSVEATYNNMKYSFTTQIIKN